MRTLKDQIVIAAYVAPPPPCEKNQYDPSIMETGYRLAKEAGFNLCFGYYEKWPSNKADVLKALSIAHQYGIGYLISDTNYCKSKQDPDAFLTDSHAYKDHPAFWGHQIWDEPGMVNFDTLAQMQKQYRVWFKDKLFYVNLQPYYSPPHWLHNGMWTPTTDDSADYFTYLSEYIETCKPQYLSYDFYPFRANSPHLVHPDYFIQISLMSRLAKQYDIPFWVYLQSCTWNKNEARLPSGNELLWQINTSIAYGATGLQYFCFFTPYSNRDEDYDVAMVDFYGQPTPRYEYAKLAHRQISAISERLLRCVHIGIVKSGAKTAPIPELDLIQVPEIEWIQGDTLIGVYTNGMKKYLHVVHNNLHETRQITIRFTKTIPVKITADGNTSQEHTNFVTRTLEGGAAILIEL